MKSSTIRRSNLSKEKMAVLEALSKYNNSGKNVNVTDDYAINNEPVEDGSPEVYVRPSKEKELDLLWKDFRIQKGERSPIVYLGIGFIAGIIVTLAISTFIGVSAGDISIGSASDNEVSAEVIVPSENSVNSDDEINMVSSNETNSVDTDIRETSSKQFSLFGNSKANTTSSSNSESSQQNKEYIVQDGDTMEKIVKSFYGTFSQEKIDNIVKTNNMKDANRLSIGQKLIIPSEGVTVNSAE